MGRTFWQRFSLISLFLWAFRITVVLVVVVGTYGTLSSGKYGPAQWIDIVIFGLFIVFMLFRPSGLLGSRAIQKV